MLAGNLVGQQSVNFRVFVVAAFHLPSRPVNIIRRR